MNALKENPGTLRSYLRTLVILVAVSRSGVDVVDVSADTQTDTLVPTRTPPLVEDLSEIVKTDAEGADGFSKTQEHSDGCSSLRNTKGAVHVHADGLTHSPAVRDGSSELSDGFAIVKTKTRVATKSTVIHQLASSENCLNVSMILEN